MKAIFVAALAVAATAIAAPAQAKLTPVEPQRVAAVPTEDAAMTSEPLGAMLESDYFRAPQAQAGASRASPCRLQLRLFDKTRLAAQSCH